MTVTIRPVRAEEGAVVLKFISDLAAYEQLAQSVRITLADVEALLFCERPRAFCDIAELDGVTVGFALWFYSVSTFEGRCGVHLEDLFVTPEARGSGAGKALLANLARRCRDEGLARLEWQVLDWNAPAIAFYDRLGAEAKTEWITRRLSGVTLMALAEA